MTEGGVARSSAGLRRSDGDGGTAYILGVRPKRNEEGELDEKTADRCCSAVHTSVLFRPNTNTDGNGDPDAHGCSRRNGNAHARSSGKRNGNAFADARSRGDCNNTSTPSYQHSTSNTRHRSSASSHAIRNPGGTTIQRCV